MVTPIKKRLFASFSQNNNQSLQPTLATSTQSITAFMQKPKAQIKNAKLKTGLIAGF